MVTGMLNIADEVEVLYPFNHTYNGRYEIVEIVQDGDVIVAYVVDEIGAFDHIYLQKV